MSISFECACLYFANASNAGSACGCTYRLVNAPSRFQCLFNFSDFPSPN